MPLSSSSSAGTGALGLSFSTRQQNLDLMRREVFDYVIVGGGITGAGIAREAAMRGRQVALVEGMDFASGTSSRSTKLVHGGVRYLESYEFGLVFEASNERRRLRRMAPYMVLPLPFLLPIYKGGTHGYWKIMAGMWLYDFLALFRNIQRHSMLRPPGVLKIFPRLRPDGLSGAARYYDCSVDDARLTLATLLSACEHGAVIANYASVTDLVKDDGRVIGVQVRDAVNGDEFTIRGRVVISALGPWTDSILKMDDPEARQVIRPTKGVHFLVRRERIGSDHALGFFSPRDKRLMFLVPWRDFCIVGTTDTDFVGDCGAIYADAGDVDYILDAINAQFPGLNLSRDDIISAYAGVRPLLAESGDDVSESKVSREHKIWHTASGLLCIAGGKLTTHRSMASQLVDVAERAFEQRTGHRRRDDPHSDREALFGRTPSGMRAQLATQARRAVRGRVADDTIEHLLRAYDADYASILAILDERPDLGARIAAELPYIWAEVVHAVRNEMAISLLDVLQRRLHILGEEKNQGLDHAERAAQIMAGEMGWSPDEQQRQVDAYRAEVQRTRAYRERA